MNKRRYIQLTFVISIALSLLVSLNAVAQDDVEMIEPDAGTWNTWLLESSAELRLDAPPNAAETMTEIEELRSLLATVDDAMLAQIQYWNAGVPAYRWNKMASEEYFNRAIPHPPASYGLALMNVAIYDATIAVWDTKYTYMRPRPSELENSLIPFIENSNSPAYPSEHAATAGAASEVLAFLFPDKADFFLTQAQASRNAMLHSGIYYPSDVDAGFALGQEVGRMAIAWAQANPPDPTPIDEINGGEGRWFGANPIMANGANWPTWTLSSSDEFRPEPPLAFGSDELQAEMQELRDLERNMRTTVFSRYWEYGSGALQDNLRWTQHASTLIWEYGWDDNPPKGALVYTAMHIAGYDAVVATFEAKYHYLAIRPFQYDTEFQTVIPTPNHPSYPSAHSVVSMAMLATLAELFPEDASYLTAMAQQGGEARLWAGIHFRHDIVVGEAMGHQIAERVVSSFAVTD